MAWDIWHACQSMVWRLSFSGVSVSVVDREEIGANSVPSVVALPLSIFARSSLSRHSSVMNASSTASLTQNELLVTLTFSNPGTINTTCSFLLVDTKRLEYCDPIVV